MLLPLRNSLAPLTLPRVVAAAGGGGTFDPASLAGLQLWLKGDAGVLNGSGVAASNGDGVATWQDQSGNGNDATRSGVVPTASTFGRAIVGGKPGLWIENDGLTTALSLTPPWTVIWVEQPQSLGASRRTMNSNGANIEAALGRTDGFAVYLDGPITVGTFSWTAGVSAAVSIIATATTAHCFANGIDRTGNSSGSPAWPSLTIGRSVLWNEANDTYLAEVIAYNSALSSTDRAAVESYLSTKYSLGF